MLSWIKWIFRVTTEYPKVDECMSECILNHEEPKPCDVVAFDSATTTCYLGSFATDNQGQFTLTSGTFDVYMETGYEN